MKNIIAAAIIFTAGAIWAESAEAPDRGHIKVLMHSFLRELDTMTPYLAGENGLSSEKAKQIVGESLTNLEKSLRKAPPQFKENPGFRISFGLLADHLVKTKQVFDRGEYDYARLRINSTAQLCASCHMQTPKIGNLAGLPSLASRLNTISYENANFLYTIREYPEALAMFNQLARTYPESKIPSDQLGDLYRRKLAIFARVLRDPSEAIASFNEDLKNKNLPLDVQRNIQSWIEGFEKWKSEKVNPAKLSTTDLLAYVRKSTPPNLNRRVGNSDPQLLNLLRNSGLLYQRLFSTAGTGSDTQEILYALAEIERSLSPLYLYSVSEIYLRECIVKYPKSATSRKCLDSYKAGMNERYFAKPIPEGVKRSIEALEVYVK